MYDLWLKAISRFLFVILVGISALVAVVPFAFSETQNFSLTLLPSQASVVPGATTNYQVQASGQASWTGLIKLSATDLPRGISVTFKPPVISSARGSQTSTIDVSADPTVSPGRALSFTVAGHAVIDGKPVNRHISAQLTVVSIGTGTVSGRVLAAGDGRPVGGLTLTLGDRTVTTDMTGNFLFQAAPAGNQLLKVDTTSLARINPEAHLHAHSVLLHMKPNTATALSDPIYVLEEHPTRYPIVPGQSAVIKPAHIPGLTMTIPPGTTIKGDDGQPHTQVAITALSPDRVPPFPKETAPRTVYLFSFGKPGGGTPNKPIPISYPNDLGALPGERIDLSPMMPTAMSPRCRILKGI